MDYHFYNFFEKIFIFYDNKFKYNKFIENTDLVTMH